MFCPNCGSQVAEGTAFCGACGSRLATEAPKPVEATPVETAPVIVPAPAPVAETPVAEAPKYEAPLTDTKTITVSDTNGEVLSKRQFIKLPENKKLLSNIRGGAILCYIVAVVTAIVYYVQYGGLDVEIIVGCVFIAAGGLICHLTMSRVASLIYAGIVIAAYVYTLVESGVSSGYLLIVGAIFLVIYNFKAASAYKRYKKSIEH